MLKSTDLKKIGTIVKNTTEAFEKGVTISYESRIKNLTTLQKFLKENEKNFSEALFKDLHMNDLACNVEIHEPCNTAEEAMENLSTWMKPSHPSIPLLQKPGSATIEKEPFGVVLIIAPWNYPVGLLMKPMIGAIAAGNAVIIKPSEVTENVSNVFAEKFKTFFPGDEISVVTGGVAETSELLKHKFDYIFYTGSPEVGKIIMRAASEHLTPVTLELGGKCPVYVDSEVDMEVAVSRISFGKWFNAGQTCVAPDYILCDQSKKEEFMKKMASKITQFFGENPQQSDDFGRIVSEKHVKRLEGLIQNEKIYHGGKVIDLKDRYFEPTILDNPDVNSKVMKDEIFGPILPIIGVSGLDEGIKFILSLKDKPLASYIFTSNSDKQQKFIKKISSGGASINDTVMHNICPELPFGGVGKSGLGRGYNGKYSFDIFSHEKSVLNKATWMDSSMRYPPYTKQKIKTLVFLQNLKLKNYLVYLMVPVILIAIAIAYKFLKK